VGEIVNSRTYKVDSHGKKFSVEIFENSHSLLQTIKARTLNWGDLGSESGETKACPLSKAEEYLMNGWNEPLKKVMDGVAKAERLEPRKSVKFQASPTGYAPHVPNTLLGLPNTMITSTIDYKRSKIVSICYDGDVSWNVSEEQVREYSTKVLAYIIGLEKQGFRVRLYSLTSFNNRNSRPYDSYSMFLKIKDEHQPLDIKRTMFTMCNAGFQRRIGFRWYETYPGSVRFSGYGRPMRNEFNQEIIKGFITQVLGKNANYIHYGKSMEDIDKNVKINERKEV
jgi:hypothetical protein